jgi:hypothetical protein
MRLIDQLGKKRRPDVALLDLSIPAWTATSWRGD